MKVLKVIGGLIALALVVIALVVFIGLQNINGIVKTAVETVGPDVTGTAV
ncbi:MAG: hypothetical protein AseanaTS_18160 [Candidatus Pelagadaptatus aseana]